MASALPGAVVLVAVALVHTGSWVRAAAIRAAAEAEAAVYQAAAGRSASTAIAGYVSGSTTAGTNGGGTGVNGFVSITYVDPVVRVQKITTGGVGGPFTFTRTNLASAPLGITTTTVGVAAPAAPAAITVSTVGTAVTLTETAAAGYVFTSASCTDANSAVTGNVGAIGTVAGTTLTIPAANVKSSADFTCVFNNIRRPSVTLTKISNGAVGGFTFTGTNGWASQTITTVTAGVGVTGATQILAAASTATTITETIPAGYVLTSVTCSGMGSGGTATPNLATGAVAFNAAATALGSNITCTFTNTRRPSVTLTKVSNGAVGGFTFTGTNGWASQTITTVTAGVGVTGATQILAAASTATTITETIPAGYVLTSVTCSGMGAGGTATPNLATGAVVFNAAATSLGSNITCTFTNTRLPRVTLTKISNGGVGGFTFTGTNGWASQTITTVTSGVGVTGATQTLTAASTSTTITETVPAGYSLASATCSGMNGGTATLAGNVLTLNAAATAPGNTVACTFTNTRLPTVTLTKISNGGVGGFTFTGTNGWASQTITTVTSGVGVTGATQTLTAASTSTTITETVPAGYSLASATCSGLGGGTATLAGNVLTLNAAATAPGNTVACTFTNTRLPTVTLTKISNGGVGGFVFNGTNGFGAAQIITTVTSGVGVTGATRTLAAASTSTTITETIPAGYVLASVTCSGLGSGGTATPNLSTGAVVFNAAATAAGSNISCTFTNTRLPTVTLTKISNGDVGGFTFTGTNGWASQTITTVTSGVGVTGATQTLTAASTATTITETIPAGYDLASITCSGLGSGGTATPNLSTGAVVFNAAATAAGSNISCTFTNTRLPTVTLTKISNGGVGGFVFNGTNGFGAAQIITTVTSGVGVTGATRTLAAASTSTTITETIPAGYVLASVTCSGLGSGGTATPNLSTGAVVFNAAATAAGSNISCTFTNTRLPTVTLTKISNGDVGGFTFTGTNGWASQTITTVTSGVGVTGATQTLTAASTATTITETIPAGYDLASITCSGLGSGGTATPNLSTGAVVFNAAATAAGSNISCTFTNTRLPTVTLTKISNGDVGGFTFTGTNGWASQTITTVTSGVGVTGATQTLTAASTATTITETIPAGYILTSITCSGLGGGTATPNLATGEVTLDATATAAANAIACTFTNARLPSVTVTKISNGGIGSFTFNGSNGFGSDTITTVTPGTGVAGVTKTLTAASTVTVITETIPAGYILTAASCTGIGAGTATANLAAGEITLDAVATAAAHNIACSFTDSTVPLSLSKTADVPSVSTVGSLITYSIVVTNTGASLPITSLTVTDTLGTPVCATSGDATIASLAAGASETCTTTYTATQVDFDGNGGGDGDIDNSAGAAGTVAGQPTTAVAAASVILNLNPQLTIVKIADTAGPAVANDVITYTYTVTNTGNLTINDVSIADVHNGYGTLPVPTGETLTSDVSPFGNSTDVTPNNGTWSVLASGDAVTFTASYTVTQTDVDLLQ